MENFNKSMLEKLKNVRSAEALLALAKENGIDMTEAEAADGFAKIKSGITALKDSDLDNVSGGMAVLTSVAGEGLAAAIRKSSNESLIRLAECLVI